jgi:hypothetical protein
MAREPAAQRVAEALDDADHLGDAGHRTARGGALRRPLRRPGFARALGSLHGHVEGNGDLDRITGGLVLAAWAALLVAIGIALICRRDVAD